MEMVERVARAICCPVTCLYPGKCDWKAYRPQARAAIEAMREPTADMATAGTCAGPNNDNPDGKPTADEIWRAMIDAALAETAT